MKALAGFTSLLKFAFRPLPDCRTRKIRSGTPYSRWLMASLPHFAILPTTQRTRELHDRDGSRVSGSSVLPSNFSHRTNFSTYHIRQRAEMSNNIFVSPIYRYHQARNKASGRERERTCFISTSHVLFLIFFYILWNNRMTDFKFFFNVHCTRALSRITLKAWISTGKNMKRNRDPEERVTLRRRNAEAAADVGRFLNCIFMLVRISGSTEGSRNFRREERSLLYRRRNSCLWPAVNVSWLHCGMKKLEATWLILCRTIHAIFSFILPNYGIASYEGRSA